MYFPPDEPVTFQRDNAYENVSKIIKIYDCKYRINRSDSNCVRKSFFSVDQTESITSRQSVQFD